MLPTREVLQRAIKKRLNKGKVQEQAGTEMRDDVQLPEFVLFGASMTEWSFDEGTQGLGWFLQQTYKDKINVLNEGSIS
jgi:hypothetical protein